MFTDTLVIGQRVSCSLYYCGEGIIYDIRGEQSPEGVKSLGGGIGFAGGNAKVSVVFLQGSLGVDLPEGLLRSGLQWEVFSEVADADEIAAALKHAKQCEAKRRAAKHRANQAFYAEKRALLQHADNKGLKRVNEHKHAAAANVRTLLKRAFPGVKFSVRKGACYGSLAVQWTDGPTVDQVRGITDRFKLGKFDSMDDSYTYVRSAFTALYGGADYINITREKSDAFIAQGIEALWAKYPGNAAKVAKPTVEEFRRGETFKLMLPGIKDSVQNLLHNVMWHLPAQ